MKKLVSLLIAAALCVSAAGFGQGTPYTYAAEKTTQSAAAVKAPQVTVSARGYDALKISWKKVAGATSYKVYRSTAKAGTYKRIKTTKSLAYSDTGVDQNKRYYYKVKAVKDSSAGKYSAVKSGKINTVVSLSSVPAYSGKPYAAVKSNVPAFSKKMKSQKTSYEKYSKLDAAGRCGICVANIGVDLMPTEERGSIGMVKPTGWHTVKYDNVDGKYLYNRCHLIGYQLTGENANTRNLITGTRYMNVDGMLPFENMVADYIKETKNHVLYRVVPIFSGSDLVARGVQMEAFSVEDKGEGISFNVFVYNVQPGIQIDYADGESRRSGSVQNPDKPGAEVSSTYVLNTNTKKFHYATCRSVKQMSEKNKKAYDGKRSDIIKQGYAPCKICNP